MKRNLIFLVLVNILVFAYFQLEGLTTSGGHEPLPALNPEQVKLLSDKELAALPPAPPVDVPLNLVTDKELQTLPSVNPVVVTQANAGALALQCLEWGSFNADQLKKAQDALAKLGLQAQLLENPSQDAKRFWIYIPPATSLASAEKKVEVLRQHGVEQTYIVQEPKWRYAISLGIFQDEKLADNLMRELKTKGIKTAVKGLRKKEGAQTILALNQVPVDKLEALKQAKKAFTEAELKEVTCH
jgi:hypothetical protein